MSNETQQPQKSANIYELMQRFWRENEYKPFSTAAIALYHYLLDRANTRRWQMPVACPTDVAAHAIGVSKQTIVAARKTLQDREFIRFTPGAGKGKHSNYWLTPNWSRGLSPGLSEKLSLNLSENLTDDLSVGLTDDLSVDLSPYNIKDIDKKNKDSYIYKKNDKTVLTMAELHASMSTDETWLQHVLSLLSPADAIGIDDLRQYLARFFDYNQRKGMKGREEKACRTHFENWMKMQPLTKQTPNHNQNNSNGQQSISSSDRRGTQVTATSPSDYEGAL